MVQALTFLQYAPATRLQGLGAQRKREPGCVILQAFRSNDRKETHDMTSTTGWSRLCLPGSEWSHWERRVGSHMTPFCTIGWVAGVMTTRRNDSAFAAVVTTTQNGTILRGRSVRAPVSAS